MDNSFMLCAWLIAFEKKSKVICYAHDIVCSHLKNDSLLESGTLNKRKSLNLWITGKENNRQLQFVEFDNYIICRLNRKPVSIQSIEIKKEFNLNQILDVVVNFPGMLEKRKTKDFTTGKEIILKQKYLTESEKIEYAKRKLNENGMNVLEISLNEGTRNIHFNKNQRHISLLSYEVIVRVEIINIELFKNAVINGIGRRKTWGFGMLRFPEFKSRLEN